MTLKFPNPSRSFEAAGNHVCFWGYDSVIEVSFFVEEEALKKLCPDMSNTEAGFLKAFDSVRNNIYAVADKVYLSSRKHSFAYTLAADDF